MSGLGLAFPLEAAAPLVKAVISPAPHMVRPGLTAGLGLMLVLLGALCLLPLASWLGRTLERSLSRLRQALVRWTRLPCPLFPSALFQGGFLSPCFSRKIAPGLCHQGEGLGNALPQS